MLTSTSHGRHAARAVGAPHEPLRDDAPQRRRPASRGPAAAGAGGRSRPCGSPSRWRPWCAWWRARGGRSRRRSGPSRTVARSRISPTRITSGSWRRTRRRASREGLGVGAHLALVDDRALVAVEHLDRVLDRSRCARATRRLMRSIIAARVVLLPEPVAPVTRTMPRSSSASRPTTVGQAQVLERRHGGRHGPHDHADRAALAEGVHAEAPDARARVGEVDLAGGIELRPPAGLAVEQLAEDALGVAAGHRRLVGNAPQLPVHAHHRRSRDLQVQVARRRAQRGARGGPRGRAGAVGRAARRERLPRPCVSAGAARLHEPRATDQRRPPAKATRRASARAAARDFQVVHHRGRRRLRARGPAAPALVIDTPIPADLAGLDAREAAVRLRDRVLAGGTADEWVLLGPPAGSTAARWRNAPTARRSTCGPATWGRRWAWRSWRGRRGPTVRSGRGGPAAARDGEPAEPARRLQPGLARRIPAAGARRRARPGGGPSRSIRGPPGAERLGPLGALGNGLAGRNP